jgi:hypothetical protein
MTFERLLIEVGSLGYGMHLMMLKRRLILAIFGVLLQKSLLRDQKCSGKHELTETGIF